MFSPVLDARQRDRALAHLGSHEVDVLVVGGGATGAGVALDAVARGLSVGLVEAQDWAAGTSSRSSKLIHGGLRYLYQFNVPLVAEALHERGLLMSYLAPHLVTAQPFLWPLLTPVVERSYSAVGVGAYDMLAFVGSLGARTMPPQKHYGKAGVRQIAPGLAEDAYRGAIRFFDARVDDARLVLGLVRTGVAYGVQAASRTRVEEYVKADGRVVGARVTDLESGREFTVRARNVVNATGVWTQESEALAGVASGLRVLASKGIHIVVPKDRIESETGIFLRTEKSVLFIIPWERYWVIGTTDTPYHGDLTEPVASADDVDYVLEHANGVLAKPLTRDDVIGTYAGLRPLVQATTTEGEDLGAAKATTKVSREHVVMQAAPGLTVIAGGKLTTYRVMAEDAVDAVLGEAAAKERPSITERLPLVGAVGHGVVVAQAAHTATRTGWSRAQVDHLISRYGDEIRTIEALADEDASLKAPLVGAPEYLRAEVAFATRYEGALHVEDVLRHRIRLDYEHRDRGLSAAQEVAEIMAPLRGWSTEDVRAQVDAYRQRVEMIASAEAVRELAWSPDAEDQAPRMLGDPHPDEGEFDDADGDDAEHARSGPDVDSGRPSLHVVPD
ncbi:MAG: glycerol-3-phosphate dehydrogenase/oxidase [Dermatophilus congolensis]|nr:glycerol-3-phosphate dehydrogenase/oxidase [Dermatophilus congolensis]